MIAQTAREQIAAMDEVIERGLSLPLPARLSIAAEVLAAQIALNRMLLAEIEWLRSRLDRLEGER